MWAMNKIKKFYAFEDVYYSVNLSKWKKDFNRNNSVHYVKCNSLQSILRSHLRHEL